VQEISFDWVWSGRLRAEFVELSGDDRAALSERVQLISTNPWPDFNRKYFVRDLPHNLQELIGQDIHLIEYIDDEWIVVYEVMQPSVFVIYSFARI